MQRIKLMTDSASDLPNELAQQLGIEIIPFPIAVDGKGYMEGVDFTPRQFYDIMQNAKEIPTTSQIPTVTYCEHYYSAFEKGYTDVILVGISSSASATFLRAQDAVEMFFENCPQAKGKFNIHILDSKTFSLGYGYPMMQAARLVREGKTVEQILAYLTGWLDRIDLYITAFSVEVGTHQLCFQHCRRSAGHPTDHPHPQGRDENYRKGARQQRRRTEDGTDCPAAHCSGFSVFDVGRYPTWRP